jgi:hypothetical protein
VSDDVTDVVGEQPPSLITREPNPPVRSEQDHPGTQRVHSLPQSRDLLLPPGGGFGVLVRLGEVRAEEVQDEPIALGKSRRVRSSPSTRRGEGAKRRRVPSWYSVPTRR